MIKADQGYFSASACKSVSADPSIMKMWRHVAVPTAAVQAWPSIALAKRNPIAGSQERSKHAVQGRASP